jgi:hypothetical protein
MAIKPPPATSIIAALYSRAGKGSAAPGWSAGKWKSFIRPCSVKSNAVMIRIKARAYGDQASSFDMMLLLFKAPDPPSQSAGKSDPAKVDDGGALSDRRETAGVLVAEGSTDIMAGQTAFDHIGDITPSCLAAGAMRGTWFPSRVTTWAASPITKMLGCPGTVRSGSTSKRADWPRDVGWRKRGGRNLVKQRLEQVMIATVDDGDAHRSARKMAGDLKTAEAGADDDDVMRRSNHSRFSLASPGSRQEVTKRRKPPVSSLPTLKRSRIMPETATAGRRTRALRAGI